MAAPTLTPPKHDTDRRTDGHTDRNRDPFRHIVEDAEAARHAIDTRTPIRALCGKTWVPNRLRPGRSKALCVVCDHLAANIYPHQF